MKDNYIKQKVLDDDGYTYLVTDKATGKKAVLKYVDKNDRYIYEILMENKSTHIVNIYSIEECNEDDYKNCIKIYEEYVEGITIDEKISEGYIYNEKLAASIICQLCAGISEVHKCKIIHRDIKPSNVIIDKNGKAVLIDFGIARMFKEDKTDDTRHLGTAGFAAPEQFGFGQSDIATDIYGLGVLLNVMLTGRLTKDVVYAGRLGKVIRKCINVEPAKRYRSVNVLENRIRRTVTGMNRIIYGSITAILVAILIVIWMVMSQNDSDRSTAVNKNVEKYTEPVYQNYYGDWTEDGKDISESGGTKLTVRAFSSAGIAFDYYKYSGKPYYREARIERVEVKLKDGVGTFSFEDDGFGNSGYGTITIRNKKIDVDIAIDNYAAENIYNSKGKVKLIKCD